MCAKELYKWAVSKKTGFKPETATALQSLYDYITGKPIDPKIEARWRELGRIKGKKVVLEKEALEGDATGIAWIIIGLEYEGMVERSR